MNETQEVQQEPHEEQQNRPCPAVTEILQLQCVYQDLKTQIGAQLKAKRGVNEEIQSILASITRERRRLASQKPELYLNELDDARQQIIRAEKRVQLLREEFARRQEACEEQQRDEQSNVILHQLVRQRNDLRETLELCAQEFERQHAERQSAIAELRQEYLVLRRGY